MASAPAALAQPAPSRQGERFPSDFKGTVTYVGNYSGRVVTASRPPRNLTLNEMMRAATAAQGTEIGGTFTLTLQFNGSVVDGQYRTTGRLRSDRITGSRIGDSCTFQDRSARWTARCGPTSFLASLSTYQGVTPSMSATVNAAATDVRDVGAIERERAIAAEENARQRKIAADEAAAKEAAEAARVDKLLNSLPPPRR